MDEFTRIVRDAVFNDPPVLEEYKNYCRENGVSTGAKVCRLAEIIREYEVNRILEGDRLKGSTADRLLCALVERVDTLRIAFEIYGAIESTAR